MKNNVKLLEQWQRFVKSHYRPSRFTRELYEALYMSSGFIAHFDKNGFHKARFWTTHALDYTLETMAKSPKLKALIDSVNIDEQIQARLTIARGEYSTLCAQAAVMLEHAARIKAQYREELF